MGETACCTGSLPSAPRSAFEVGDQTLLGGATPSERTLPSLIAMSARATAARPHREVLAGIVQRLWRRDRRYHRRALCAALRPRTGDARRRRRPGFHGHLIVDPDAAFRIAPLVRFDPLVNRVLCPRNPFRRSRNTTECGTSMHCCSPASTTRRSSTTFYPMGVPPASVDPADEASRLRIAETVEETRGRPSRPSGADALVPSDGIGQCAEHPRRPRDANRRRHPAS